MARRPDPAPVITAPVGWTGIVKVQRELSLLSRPAGRSVLVYSEDKDLFLIGALTPDLARWFKEGEVKFYAVAELSRDMQTLRFVRKVRRQPW